MAKPLRIKAPAPAAAELDKRIDAFSDQAGTRNRLQETLEPILATQARRSPIGAPRPWIGLDATSKVQCNIDLPRVLHAKLKWLGSTTYGESMTSIVVKALEAETKRRLKALGEDPA